MGTYCKWCKTHTKPVINIESWGGIIAVSRCSKCNVAY